MGWFDWFSKQSPPSDGPDLSKIDSRLKAEAMFARGELEKLFLMPLEFGGEDNPLNTLFVPIGIAGIKSRLDNGVIAPLVASGEVTEYQASPEYQGASVIPIAVAIVASNPGNFATTINIWGDALSRDDA